jgi:cardiolipin synthase A/B
VNFLIEFWNREPSLHWAIILLVIHTVLTTAIIVRLVMGNRSVGATLSWIATIFLFPMVGPCLYLLIGELRLGSKRAKLVRRLVEPMRVRYQALDRPHWNVAWNSIGDDYQMLAHAGQRMLMVPPVGGNRYELVTHWEDAFDRIIADIQSAQVNCDLEFYIWHDAGRARDVSQALIQAAKRGVMCRVLVDAIGSRLFLKSRAADELRRAGVQVQVALPGGLWRMLFVRFDLRLHRKIVLIDDQIGWTGSLNLVDPRYFKQEAGVGQWVDAMVRVEGPAVEALAITFQADWYVETESAAEHLPDLTGDQEIKSLGTTAIQVLPSGPANQVEAIERLLMTAVYSAREELIITTPYFVCSDALQMALVSAALSGVDVTVIVPERVDSWLVRWASQAYIENLLQAGVRIATFHGGLLHTKSVTIDGRASLFGSLNMDPRSFRLNFEITLAVFDQGFTAELRDRQQSYLAQCRILELETWRKRPISHQVVEKMARLVSPLL